MGKSESSGRIISERIVSGGQQNNPETKENSPVMGQVIDEVIYLLDDESKKNQFRVEDEFEELLEEYERGDFEIYGGKSQDPLLASPSNKNSDSEEKLSEDGSGSDHARLELHNSDLEKDMEINSSEDERELCVEEIEKSDPSPVREKIEKSDLSPVRENITNGKGDKSESESKETSAKKIYTLLSNDLLHFSLKKAFYPGIVANNHMWMLMDCQPAYEEADVDVLNDAEICLSIPIDSIEIDDDDDDDEFLTALQIDRDRLPKSDFDASMDVDKSSNNSRSTIVNRTITENLVIEKQKEKQNKGSASAKNLSWNPQASSNLEKKSIIIGGVVKKIISSGKQPGLTTSMKAIINKNGIKTVIRPITGGGSSILKTIDGQIRPVRIVNPPKSLLKPLKPKPSSESPQGEFIKISDIQGESNVKVSANSGSKSSTQITVPTIKFIPKPSLSTSQSHLLNSSPRPLQSILKPASGTPATQPTSTTSQAPRLLKVTPISKSSTCNNPSVMATSYSCRFCNVLFSKQESLRVHQISKHLDKLKTTQSPGTLCPPLPSGKPVLLSLKNGKTQLKNVFILPKNARVIQKPQSQPQPQTQANQVSLADLLELERELADHSEHCDECQSRKYSVSDLKLHARVHPHGDETCGRCIRCFKLYKNCMSHLETHVPESDSDCEFVSEEKLS